MLIGNQSSICESLMRPKRISNDIGRKHGIELIALEKHQRVIVESFTFQAFLSLSRYRLISNIYRFISQENTIIIYIIILIKRIFRKNQANGTR